MAEKRMISSKITDHDNFTTLPATAQALYLHLILSADDDGFCAQTNSAMLKAHARKKDLDELVKRKYLIRFSNGVCAIKHWKMQNSIRPDRYHPTEYKEELTTLSVKSNGSYTTAKAQPNRGQDDNQSATNCQPEDGQSADTLPSNRDNLQPEYLGLGLGLDNTAAVNARAREGEDQKNDLGRVMGFFFDRINPMPSEMAIDALKDYTADLGADVVLHALEIAVDERKTGWRYIQGILQRYRRDGFTDLPAVLKAEAEYAARGGGKTNGRNRDSGKPDGSAETEQQFNIRYDVEG